MGITHIFLVLSINFRGGILFFLYLYDMGRYNYTKALEKLTQWGKSEGYKISFNHNDISYIKWKKRSLNEPTEIRIEGKYSNELKTYLLLHELGHHQLRKDWGLFEKELPVTAKAEYIHLFENISKYKRRKDYYVSSMEEEFKAWEEGKKLAEELGIRINEVKWNDFKTECLMSYMRYYSKKK